MASDCEESLASIVAGLELELGFCEDRGRTSAQKGAACRGGPVCVPTGLATGHLKLQIRSRTPRLSPPMATHQLSL